MGSLFVGDFLVLLESLLTVSVLLFIAVVLIKGKSIKKWGGLILLLVIGGLVLCCIAVTRDNYILALQGGNGLFALNSIQINASYIAASVNGFAALSSVFVKNQKYRKAMFVVLSISIVLKIILIESSRLLVL